MTFATRETSVELGQPVELYYFQIGANAYRYTSVEDEVSFGGNTYYPRVIHRNDPAQASDDRSQEMLITLPTSDELSQRYIVTVPGQPTTLTVTRYHRGDTEAYILWKGEIVGSSFTNQGQTCQFRGVSKEISFNREIPRFKYQGLCNHVLYDTRCGISSASYKYTGTCSAVSGTTLTIDGLAAAKGSTWAIGGYIDFGGNDYRPILSQSGDDLVVRMPFEHTPLGQDLDVYAGCDHTIDTCHAKFSNEENYGGFPYVPTLNPFVTGLE